MPRAVGSGISADAMKSGVLKIGRTNIQSSARTAYCDRVVPTIQSRRPLVQFQDRLGLSAVRFGLRDQSAQEEGAPSGPVAIARDCQQPIVIFVAMGLEEFGQVEIRPGQQPARCEKQRDDQSAEAAIAVEEGMDRLELGMDDGELHQPIRRIGMDVAFPCIHAGLQRIRPARHEPRPVRSCNRRDRSSSECDDIRRGPCCGRALRPSGRGGSPSPAAATRAVRPSSGSPRSARRDNSGPRGYPPSSACSHRRAHLPPRTRALRRAWPGCP